MIDWTAPDYFSNDGIDLAYWQSGPANSRWPAIIFSHGFPELAYSWRHQMDVLASEGFRCIALDQRGYGRSTSGLDVKRYGMADLCSDIAGLARYLETGPVIYCGHDWGGLVVWQMPLRHPESVAGIISLNTPYTKRSPKDPVALYRKRFGEDFYIVWFQEAVDPEAVLERDVATTLAYFAQKPEEAHRSSADARSGSSLRETLRAFNRNDARDLVMNETAFAYYMEAYERSGFEGPINWYRNFSENWLQSEGQHDHVPHPSLMILAELDPVLPPEAANGMERYVPDLETILISGSGHWTQQEKPDEVNAAIANWITRRFSDNA